MFEKEIQRKATVDLFDNNMQMVISGAITGFKEQLQTIVINGRLYFPLKHIAKICVQTDSHIRHNTDKMAVK